MPPTDCKNYSKGPNHQVFGGLVEFTSGVQMDVEGRGDGADITVAAPAGNDRSVTVQVNDAQGNPVAAIQTLKLYLFLDAAGAAFAVTGGSTGIADIGEGAILALVAKKAFVARTNAVGLLELQWTDTASEVAYLGVELPSGRLVISDALTI